MVNIPKQFFIVLLLSFHFMTFSFMYMDRRFPLWRFFPRKDYKVSEFSTTRSGQHPTKEFKRVPPETWRQLAVNHKKTLKENLYPPNKVEIKKVQQGKHQINDHPIFNFLHRYYRYSMEELSKYSPGMNVILEGVQDHDLRTGLLSTTFLDYDKETHEAHYSPTLFQQQLSKEGKYKTTNMTHNYQILVSTSQKSGFFGCFGMHEWAMLYEGTHSPAKTPHQKALSLRVSQATINEMIEKHPLRCTHYDAWRFFHDEAQTRNAIRNMTRYTQVHYDQPACIHANMDLFKYAYQLYPLISSDLLLCAVQVAIIARKMDIRASPYDVSKIVGCEDTLFVETSEGRKRYIQEQEALYHLGMPVRKELLAVYQEAFGHTVQTIQADKNSSMSEEVYDGQQCASSGRCGNTQCAVRAHGH